MEQRKILESNTNESAGPMQSMASKNKQDDMPLLKVVEQAARELKQENQQQVQLFHNPKVPKIKKK